MKKIIDTLRNHYWKKWIRRHKCKVAGGVLSLYKRSTLTIEEGVSLGYVVIESKKLDIGAHTYIRSDCVLSAVDSALLAAVVLSGNKRLHIRQTGSVHILFNTPIQA